MTNDVFCQPEGVYIVLVRSQLWILTPGFNQSSRGESGKCSSPVCLPVWLVKGCMCVTGLRLVAVVSHLVVKKMIPTPKSGQDQTSWYVLCPVREM